MANIEVAKNRCKGCRLCILNCPKGIIGIGSEVNALGYFTAVQTDASQCNACTLCANMCPDTAISVYR